MHHVARRYTAARLIALQLQRRAGWLQSQRAGNRGILAWRPGAHIGAPIDQLAPQQEGATELRRAWYEPDAARGGVGAGNLVALHCQQQAIVGAGQRRSRYATRGRCQNDRHHDPKQE